MLNVRPEVNLDSTVSFTYGKIWLQAYMSGADVSLVSLVGMGFRQVNPRIIITAKVMAT